MLKINHYQKKLPRYKFNNSEKMVALLFILAIVVIALIVVELITINQLLSEVTQ